MNKSWFYIVLTFLFSSYMRILAGILSLLISVLLTWGIISNQNKIEDIYWIGFGYVLSMVFANYALRGNDGSKHGFSGWLYWLFIGWPGVFLILIMTYRIILLNHSKVNRDFSLINSAPKNKIVQGILNGNFSDWTATFWLDSLTKS
jgi:hypothetical protein